MTILIASQIDAANSDQVIVREKESVVVVATTGVAAGEESEIEIKTTTDGWTPSGELLSDTSPSARINGPIVFRVAKLASTLAYAVEMTRNTGSDLA